MFIDSEKRLKQLSDEAKKNTEDLEEAKKNSRFTQVSPKGWERVRELLKDSQGISALEAVLIFSGAYRSYVWRCRCGSAIPS